VNSNTKFTWVSEPRDERIGAVAQIGVGLAGVLHLPSHLLATATIATLVKATRGRRNLQIESGEFHRHLSVWPEQEAVDPAFSIFCRRDPHLCVASGASAPYVSATTPLRPHFNPSAMKPWPMHLAVHLRVQRGVVVAGAYLAIVIAIPPQYFLSSQALPA
jgi:hypothetical protein